MKIKMVTFISFYTVALETDKKKEKIVHLSF